MTAFLDTLGPHAGFILACYVVTALVVAALFVWLFADRARLTREIAALEAKGITRRSTSAGNGEARR
ncbi:MAG: heme exporter protein CcmD [Stappia sp.]|uniref:heme exporter protein CcmD n=1 Tax=Stappia sp. TaxID=1870903 RepID=UPI000C6220CA|nr:heme exporter protein CcmD [Stappia sp.]MAA98979.1 heme exporter protein CcmD [Stappia sp.]MBM18397.1 heme exporter protein CcmD [Stappia sp.]|tara:strand:+ start:968 stop:1168 length:201 start_codon:yes stop_codon:yes gene_type:complete